MKSAGRRASSPDLIDGWKNRGLIPSRVPAAEAQSYGNGKGGTLYAEYQERLKVLNAADFGDLLLEVLLFQEHPDVLKDYQRRFKYMLVDEYQDTNVAQYLWLRLLSQGRPRCAIIPPRFLYSGASKTRTRIRASEDPSLDSGRASAHPGMTRQRPRLAQQYLLRRRRRSVDLWLARRGGRQHPALRKGLPRRPRHQAGAQLPLDAAISSVPPRASSPRMKAGSARPSTPTATKARRSPSAHWDGDEEARAIGEDIENLQRKGENLNDMAILVRASFQMRAFEDRFITLGVPYRVVGGPRFYERAEIRDALAYFKVTVSRPTIWLLSASSTCRSAASARPRSSACTPSPAPWRFALTPRAEC